MKKFSGVGVALITPFTNNGQVDEISLRRLVDHVIDNGVDYLVALGTTSEAATFLYFWSRREQYTTSITGFEYTTLCSAGRCHFKRNPLL